MRYVPAAAEELAALQRDGWHVDGNAIRREFASASFGTAGALVADIARLADQVDHHPDLDLRYPGRVVVVLTTHATGGVSDADASLAREISALAARSGAATDTGGPPPGR